MVDRSRPVLVVEDDAELRGLMEAALDAIGYRVMTAGEGRQALELVEQEMPAAILLDLRMPGMNGWEFSREFRARYGRRAPIVVVTAATSAEQQAEELEAEGFLDKPFDLQDLIRMLERMWARTPAEVATEDSEEARSDEAEMVAAVAGGDETAFLQLYETYKYRIYRYVYYRVGRTVDAEDLTQQIFMQAWSALGRYQHVGKPFSAWLFTIAHNVVVNFYRKTQSAARQGEAPLIGDLADLRVAGSPELEAEARWQVERIQVAMRQLKPIYQQVILLRFLEHMDCNEIAAAVGKSAANVRVMQFRALKQLRQIMVQEDQKV